MKPIRVALSGSGFKFPAHVGALLAIQDAGYSVVEIAGTSGGSIVAALFAARAMTLEEMRALTLTRNWSDMLGLNLWSLLTNMGYCNGKTLLDFLTEHTEGMTFKDLPVDLKVVASDVANGCPFIFSKENTPDLSVALAARASAAIPFVYSPVQIKDALLMDGGMEDNIAADLLQDDATRKIGIRLVAKEKPLGPGTYSFATIIPRVIDLMLTANENTHVDFGKSRGAQYSFIETGYASGLDCNMSASIRRRLMDDGYAETAKTLSAIT